jgi:hypothetical protein
MRQNRTLSAKQRRALDGLLAAGTVAGAAQRAGCSRDSVYRWLRDDPAFVQALRKAEAAATEAVSRRLLRLADTAADTLDEAMTSTASPPAVRVRSASVVLSALLRIRELATLETRLTQLEASAGLSEWSS